MARICICRISGDAGHVRSRYVHKVQRGSDGELLACAFMTAHLPILAASQVLVSLRVTRRISGIPFHAPERSALRHTRTPEMFSFSSCVVFPTYRIVRSVRKKNERFLIAPRKVSSAYTCATSAAIPLLAAENVSLIRVSYEICLSVTVNLAEPEGRNQRVDMTHFDLLKVLGTGGKYWRLFIRLFSHLPSH